MDPSLRRSGISLDNTEHQTLVSNMWRVINQGETHVAYAFLSKEIRKLEGDEQTISTIIRLSQENDIIGLLQLRDYRICNQGSFSTGQANYSTQKIKVNSFKVDRCHQILFSEYFPISWDESTLELDVEKAKKGKYKTEFNIKASILQISNCIKAPSQNILKYFKLYVERSAICEKKTGILKSWKRIKEEDVKPQGIDKLISKVINLQINLFIKYVSYLNFLTFLENGIEDLKTFKKHGNTMTWTCNQDGLIVQANNENIDFTIKIEETEINGIKVPFLSWHSNTYSSYDEEYNCTSSKILRWSIFTYTAIKIAKRLDVEFKEYLTPDEIKLKNY